MKHNRKNKLFGWLSVSMLMLTTACTSVAELDATQVSDNDEGAVTITVQPQSLASGMRGADDDEDKELDPQNNIISKGKKIDLLYYAIYVKDADDEDAAYELTNSTDIVKDQIDKESGVHKVEFADGFTKPHKIRLVLEEDKVYKMAFWAQSSKATNVFDVRDLKAVKVNYKPEAENNALNNDELRDAFCAVSDPIDVSKARNEVTLRRPFAQINVGTTGADYKNVMIGKKVFMNKTVTRSKVVLKGVATTYNVLEGKTVDEEATSVTFDFNRIPAFTDYSDDISHIALPKLEGVLIPPVSSEIAGYYNGTLDQEFLNVNLDSEDGGIAAYKYNYPTIVEKENGEIQYLTETFKYLSMCYVLVPSPEEGKTNSLLSVDVYFAEEGENDSNYKPISLLNVPARRNYRTNILGGLRFIKDPTDDPDDPGYPTPDPDDDPDDPYIPPTDPEDPTPDPGPDDPTSVFGFSNLAIYLDEMLEGENNGKLDPADPEEPEAGENDYDYEDIDNKNPGIGHSDDEDA